MQHERTDLRVETRLAGLGRGSGPGTPLNVPIVPASTFRAGSGREYARVDSTPGL